MSGVLIGIGLLLVLTTRLLSGRSMTSGRLRSPLLPMLVRVTPTLGVVVVVAGLVVTAQTRAHAMRPYQTSGQPRSSRMSWATDTPIGPIFTDGV